jgi:membrane protein YdbS with pleckstrin-like domain
VEHPLVHTRAHTAALTRPIAVALGAVAILAFVVAVLARTGHPGIFGQAAAVITAGLAIWALVRLVRSVWDWDRTMLLVSEDELVIQRGGLRRSESIVPLRAIHRLRVRRSLLGRLLGYGTIELAGPSKGSRLRFVPRPDEVSAVISTYAGRHDHVR